MNFSSEKEIKFFRGIILGLISSGGVYNMSRPIIATGLMGSLKSDLCFSLIPLLGHSFFTIGLSGSLPKVKHF